MALNEKEVTERLLALKEEAKPESRYYGRLLNWTHEGFIWHYGIGLSDTMIFDTGQGMAPFDAQAVQAKVVLGVDHLHLAPQEVISRLEAAIEAFANWDYNFLGWNCEHLARLVATDVPRSYQAKLLWFIANLTPEGDHKLARQHLTSYMVPA